MKMTVADLIFSLESKPYLDQEEKQEIIHLLKSLEDEDKRINREISEAMNLFQSLGCERDM